MSYTCDVRISTTVEGYNLLKNYCDKCSEKHQLLGNNIKPQIEEIDAKSNSAVFGWNWIQWDETFPEYSQILEGLEYLNGEKIPWEFLKIGEEDGDVERRNSSFDLPPKGLDQEIVSFYNYTDTSSYSKSINAIDEAVAFLRENEQYGDDWQDIIIALNDLRGQLLQR